MRPLKSWWDWRAAGDMVLVAALLGVGLAEVWGGLRSRSGLGSPGWSTLLVVVCTLPLVARRRHALVTVATVTTGAVVLVGLAPVYVLFYGTYVPLAVTAYSAGRYLRGRTALLASVCLVPLLLVLWITVPAERDPGSVLFDAGGLILAWAAGKGLAILGARAEESHRRAVESEAAAATRAMSAVVEERTRIARELHDIVAHAISLIVVQAGAAEPAVDDDPAFARAALASIRSTGVEALAEMRRMVTMLRDRDQAESLAPQPGVRDLDALVARVQHSGLQASLIVAGTPRPLPSGLDLAAYRIVQEALSNVRRHAQASRAWVHLTYAPDELRIEVRDDGRGAAPDRLPGHGLTGMRERATLYGGRLDTAAESGAGFTVSASLPLAPP